MLTGVTCRRIRGIGNVGGVSRRSLMASFARSTLSYVPVANFTEVSSCGRGNSFGGVQKSRRRIQQINGGESLSTKLVVTVIDGGVAQSLCERAGITKTSPDGVLFTIRKRRRSPAIGVLFATTNIV